MELEQVDYIITASTFTKQSLTQAGVREDRIRVVPLGAPSLRGRGNVLPHNSFVFLYAGAQSVHKGIHYLLQAWHRLRPGKDVELWLIGRMLLPDKALHNLPGTVVIRSPVPRQELYSIYQRASVLVFPSLFDGFGMVITEAMAHGLPVISTPNSAAPDLITSGKEGWIVPIRDPDALAEAMQWCIDHPAELAEMGRQAMARAAQQQWSDYRAHLREVVSDMFATC
jgi:glycosyltransferase involved in cell wall biosynthesis